MSLETSLALLPRALACLLAMLGGGCELFLTEPVEDEPAPDSCPGALETVSSNRFELVGTIRGVSTPRQPGPLSARLTVQLPPQLTAHVTDLKLLLTVHSGQALPGHALHLWLGRELLQSATLGGLHGNQAQFEVALDGEVCGERCELAFDLTGDRRQASAAIPLSLGGELHVYVDEESRCMGFYNGNVWTEVSHAR